MNSRNLMIASALFLGLIGLVLTFFTREVLTVHNSPLDGPTILLIQMMGAIYLGFAMLNWGARGVIIGGIYARPLAAGNVLHFVIVTLTLAREAWEHNAMQLAGSAFVFGIFAVGFGWLMFRPARAPEG